MKKQNLSEEFKRMQKLAGIIIENETPSPEFQQLLNDLESGLAAYDGEEVAYDEDEDSMEVRITIFPEERNKEILKSVKDIVKKNKLFMIDKESIERDRDEDGVTLSFDIVKNNAQNSNSASLNISKEKDHKLEYYHADDITLNGKPLDVNKFEKSSTYRDNMVGQPEKSFMYKGRPATIYGTDPDSEMILITTY
jgi:hypothetical protein